MNEVIILCAVVFAFSRLKKVEDIIADEKKTGNVCRLIHELTDCFIRLKEARPVNQGRDTRTRPAGLWQLVISLVMLIIKIVLKKIS